MTIFLELRKLELINSIFYGRLSLTVLNLFFYSCIEIIFFLFCCYIILYWLISFITYLELLSHVKFMSDSMARRSSIVFKSIEEMLFCSILCMSLNDKFKSTILLLIPIGHKVCSIDLDF